MCSLFCFVFEGRGGGGFSGCDRTRNSIGVDGRLALPYMYSGDSSDGRYKPPDPPACRRSGEEGTGQPPWDASKAR
eukprot:SAG31_NODE_396_length_16264_cov_17.206496_4_plen_76_part_00